MKGGQKRGRCCIFFFLPKEGLSDCFGRAGEGLFCLTPDLFLCRLLLRFIRLNKGECPKTILTHSPLLLNRCSLISFSVSQLNGNSFHFTLFAGLTCLLSLSQFFLATFLLCSALLNVFGATCSTGLNTSLLSEMLFQLTIFCALLCLSLCTLSIFV